MKRVYSRNDGNWSVPAALAFVLISAGLLGAAPALAQDAGGAPPTTGAAVPATETVKEPVKEKEKEEVVKTGVIASSTKTGSFAAIDVETSGASPGDEASVISASIVRGRDNECVARVTNGGAKTYSVSFAVVGTTQSGSKPLNNTYSATLKPKAVVERTVNRCAADLNLAVVLKSARPLK